MASRLYTDLIGAIKRNRVLLDSAVAHALNKAVQNGHEEFRTEDPVKVAVDLATYDPGFEGLEPEDVVPSIEAWQASLRSP